MRGRATGAESGDCGVSVAAGPRTRDPAETLRSSRGVRPPSTTLRAIGSACGKRSPRSTAERPPAERRHLLTVALPGRLDVGAFAFVMASGIVSVAAAQQGLPLLSETLFGIACFGWGTLALALAPRLLRGAWRPRLESFAFAAATAVLGTRLALMGQSVAALALGALAVLAWLALFACRPLRGRAAGGWFLVVVGTESLAALAALLAPRWGEALLEAGLAWWLLGLCLYPVVAAVVAAELRRRPCFAPAWWIAMGALAIATLADTELLLAARTLGVLPSLRPLLRDGDLTLWALASAWIAPLAVAELRSRAGWRDPRGRWSFVFPLGMYAVASRLLARAAPLAPLATVARVFFVIALLAWAIVLLGQAAACFGLTPARYNHRTTI
jgi:tellurite resistance protein TehA-like permease